MISIASGWVHRHARVVAVLKADWAPGIHKHIHTFCLSYTLSMLG